MGIADMENEELLDNFDAMLEEMKVEGDEYDLFDFFKLLFGAEDESEHSSPLEWREKLYWYQIIPFKWLKRNWFKEELYWMEDPYCSGYEVDSNPKCDLRPKEI